MARALRVKYPGVFYHVTSSGNERKAVFKSKKKVGSKNFESKTVILLIAEY
jgi:hypothetical protein